MYITALEEKVELLDAISPVEAKLTSEGRTYYVLKGTYSAADAQTKCESLNMDLAKVTSVQQSIDLGSYWGYDMPNALIWIGANDIATETVLVHRDATPVTHTPRWYKLDDGHPNTVGNDCVSLSGLYTFRGNGTGFGEDSILWGWEGCQHARYAACSAD